MANFFSPTPPENRFFNSAQSIEDVLNRYQQALGAVGGKVEGEYPAYKQPADWQSIAPQGYDALQEALISAGTRPLQEDMQTATNQYTDTLRRIGMADDPAGQQLIARDVTTPYTRAIGDVSNKAIGQRYGLESADLASYNAGMTTRGGIENQYNIGAWQDPREYYLNQMQQILGTMGPGYDQTYQTAQIPSGLNELMDRVEQASRTYQNVAGGMGAMGFSSSRFKDDIGPLEGSLDKVLKLSGKTFQWKETGRKAAGLIAEEVSEVMPVAVLNDETGRPLQIDYAAIIGSLVEAVKAQQTQIEMLINHIEG